MISDFHLAQHNLVVFLLFMDLAHFLHNHDTSPNVLSTEKFNPYKTKCPYCISIGCPSVQSNDSGAMYTADGAGCSCLEQYS